MFQKNKIRFDLITALTRSLSTLHTSYTIRNNKSKSISSSIYLLIFFSRVGKKNVLLLTLVRNFLVTSRCWEMNQKCGKWLCHFKIYCCLIKQVMKFTTGIIHFNYSFMTFILLVATNIVSIFQYKVL